MRSSTTAMREVDIIVASWQPPLVHMFCTRCLWNRTLSSRPSLPLRRRQRTAGAAHTRFRSVRVPLAVPSPQPGKESQGLRHRPARCALHNVQRHVMSTSCACWLLCLLYSFLPYDTDVPFCLTAAQGSAGRRRHLSSTMATRCGRGSWGTSSRTSSCQTAGALHRHR